LQILDSRGKPTLEAEVVLTDGTSATAQVPSGASTGKHEAKELRDGPGGAYGGRAVSAAVANVNGPLARALRGMPVDDHERADRRMIALDGTPDKSRLGANAILALSCAIARARAKSRGLPLWLSLAEGRRAKIPLPMVNILSGGLHAGRQIEFQDFLAVPHGFSTFAAALEAATRVHRRMREILHDSGRAPAGVADEGGWGPRLDSNEDALRYMVRAIESSGYTPGGQVSVAIDAAATHFYLNGKYRLASEGRSLDSDGMIGLYERWTDEFPISSIEDPLAEDDWQGWQRACQALGERCALIGDDLLVTNPARLKRAIKDRAANAVLVKMNQIGTLTETMQVVDSADAAGFAAVVSARSGETEDSFLADLAVATGAGHIKVGSITRSERLAKYNRLLRIEAGFDSHSPEGLAPIRPLVHDGSGGGKRVNNA
jgi:enolase